MGVIEKNNRLNNRGRDIGDENGGESDQKYVVWNCKTNHNKVQNCQIQIIPHKMFSQHSENESLWNVYHWMGHTYYIPYSKS